MSDARKTNLFKALKPCIRKEDHKELARMLQMVVDGRFGFIDAKGLSWAFPWTSSPQGFSYWHALSLRLERAGSGDVA